MKHTTLAVIILIVIVSCSKEKKNEKLLLGTWTLKSQVDYMGGVRGYIPFQLPSLKKLNFSDDGQVYSDGIVTPTWIFQPANGHASYHVNGDLILIGDSAVLNGASYYINLKKQFKILSVSKHSLVLQHIYPYNDPPPPQTIDSLIK